MKPWLFVSLLDVGVIQLKAIYRIGSYWFGNSNNACRIEFQPFDSAVFTAYV